MLIFFPPLAPSSSSRNCAISCHICALAFSQLRRMPPSAVTRGRSPLNLHRAAPPLQPPFVRTPARPACCMRGGRGTRGGGGGAPWHAPPRGAPPFFPPRPPPRGASPRQMPPPPHLGRGEPATAAAARRITKRCLL